MTAGSVICRRKRKPGPDGETTRQFASRFNPQALQRSLLEGSFVPSPRGLIFIQTSPVRKRRIFVSSIEVAVVERAFTQTLNKNLDHLFHESSFGGRPKVDLKKALYDWKRHSDLGFEWNVRLDIKDFFDEINQSSLMNSLSPHFGDISSSALLSNFLQTPAISRKGEIYFPKRGIGQGPCYGPFLGNHYLTPLDRFLSESGLVFARCLDDVLIYTKSLEEAENARALASAFVTEQLGLRLNSKSMTGHATNMTFLGCSLDSNHELVLSSRTRVRLHQTLLDLLRRSSSHDEYWGRVSSYLRGWFEFYRVTKDSEATMYNCMANIINLADKFDDLERKLRENPITVSDNEHDQVYLDVFQQLISP